MKKGIWALIVAAAFVGGTISVNPLAEAANPLLEEIQATVNAIKQDTTSIKTETDKIQMIKDDLTALETGVSAETESQIDYIDSNVELIKTETDKIQMAKDNQYVPFHVDGGSSTTCATPGDSGFNNIKIESDNSDKFIVHSVWITAIGVDEQIDTIRFNNIFVDNAALGATTTSDITGTTQSNIAGFEALGTTLVGGASTTPYVIASEGDGIRFFTLCSAGTTSDLVLTSIQVSGWKQADDEITVSIEDVV